MPGRSLLPVPGWREAAEAAASGDWDPAWWSWEEAERRRLQKESLVALGEAALRDALEAVTEQARSWLLGAAALAAARSGIAEAALARVAAGAASQAAFQAALALAAGAEQDHAFAAKFRLYAAARWPLAVTARGFYVF